MASSLTYVPWCCNKHKYQSSVTKFPQEVVAMPTNEFGAAMMLNEVAYPVADIGGLDFSLPDTNNMTSGATSLSSSCPDQLFHWEPLAVSALPDCGGYSYSQADMLGIGYAPAAAQHKEEAYESQQNYAPAYSTSPTLDCSWGTQDLFTTVKSTESMKVGKYSAEERRDRILRYLKKRNQRNFNKTIKYACRKTLADRRIRVRGRFAKNQAEEMAMTSNNSSSDEEKVFYPYDYSEQMKQDGDEWLQEAIASLLYIPCNVPANQLSESLLE